MRKFEEFLARYDPQALCLLYFYRYTRKAKVIIVEAQVTTAKTRNEVSILSSASISSCTSLV